MEDRGVRWIGKEGWGVEGGKGGGGLVSRSLSWSTIKICAIRHAGNMTTPVFPDCLLMLILRHDPVALLFEPTANMSSTTIDLSSGKWGDRVTH